MENAYVSSSIMHNELPIVKKENTTLPPNKKQPFIQYSVIHKNAHRHKKGKSSETNKKPKKKNSLMYCVRVCPFQKRKNADSIVPSLHFLVKNAYEWLQFDFPDALCKAGWEMDWMGIYSHRWTAAVAATFFQLLNFKVSQSQLTIKIGTGAFKWMHKNT